MSATTASDVLKTYRVTKDVFVLGSLSKGVTVYQQQCRALNLAWAFAQEEKRGKRRVGEVAIIGAGVAGLTFCAALMSVCKEPIYLLEQTWDLCPLQQGSETRWLHPELYDWPAMGSRRPGAGMQVLDWTAARAADVASRMLKTFAARCEEMERKGLRPPEVHLGLGHLRVDAGLGELDSVA
jgi:hypothetical protein